jgi:hypothetical protein
MHESIDEILELAAAASISKKKRFDLKDEKVYTTSVVSLYSRTRHYQYQEEGRCWNELLKVVLIEANTQFLDLISIIGQKKVNENVLDIWNVNKKSSMELTWE